MLTSFKAIISEAQSRGLIVHNPVQHIKISAGNGRHKKEVEIPQHHEVRRLYETLNRLAEQPDERSAKTWRRNRVLVAMAIETGFRMSELRGLPWRAIDFENGKISVIQKADEKGRIGSPKSAKSRRVIIVSQSLIRLLREWRISSPNSGSHDLVFATRNGKPEALSNIRQRCWLPLLKAARIKGEYTLNACRHYHASVLIADHATPKDVQVEMGHSSIQVTFDRYGHLFEDDAAEQVRRERANRLSQL